MKKVCAVFAFVAVMSCQMVYAETVAETINRRLGLDLNAVSIGEGFGNKLTPKQAPVMLQKQLPQLQAPPMKSEFQANIQAPSKLALPVRKAHMCSLIPGRARRLARREARQEVALQARLEGRTLLEISEAAAADAGRTIMENGQCTTCTAGSTQLTSLTTRELLEGGQIRQQIRTVNEPGICGSGGQCSGGRRGLFRR